MTTETVIYIIIAIALLALIISDRKNYWKDHAKVLLNWKMEIIIVLVLIALSFTATELMEAKKSRFTEFTMGSFTSSDIEELNVIDRSFAGKWDIVAKDLGKYFRNTAIYLIPFSLLLFRGSIKRRLVLFFIFAQGYSMTESLTGIAKGLVEVHFHNLRDYSTNKHKNVDDYQFGGGAGMVMSIEPIDACITKLKSERQYDEVIYMTPDGETLNQRVANALSLKNNLLLKNELLPDV